MKVIQWLKSLWHRLRHKVPPASATHRTESIVVAVEKPADEVEPTKQVQAVELKEIAMTLKPPTVSPVQRIGSLASLQSSDEALLSGGLVVQDVGHARKLSQSSVRSSKRSASSDEEPTASRNQPSSHTKSYVNDRDSPKKMRLHDNPVSSAASIPATRTPQTAAPDIDAINLPIHATGLFGQFVSSQLQVTWSEIKLLGKVKESPCCDFYLIELHNDQLTRVRHRFSQTNRLCLKLFHSQHVNKFLYELAALSQIGRDAKVRVAKLLAFVSDSLDEDEDSAIASTVTPMGIITPFYTLTLKQFIEMRQKGKHVAEILQVDVQTVITILRDVVAAMKAIHQLQMAHGSLNPLNVYIELVNERNDHVYRPVIAGFEECRFVGSASLAGLGGGAPLPSDPFPLMFTSPEMLQDIYGIGYADAQPQSTTSAAPLVRAQKADVFAFGMLATFVCARNTPWYDDSEVEDVIRDIIYMPDMQLDTGQMASMHEYLYPMDGEDIDGLIFLIHGCLLYDMNKRPSFDALNTNLKTLRVRKNPLMR